MKNPMTWTNSSFKTVSNMALAATLALALGGCDSYFGETEEDIVLTGERIPVMLLNNELKPDIGSETIEVRLPRPYTNRDWTHSGGNSLHVMYHLGAADALNEAWSRSIGSGSDDEASLVAPPIVSNGTLYAIDAIGMVRALNADTGAGLWRFDSRPKDEENVVVAGGIAFAEGKVFVSTGFGEVIALNAENGEEVWRNRIRAPLRGAPTVASGRVFVMTLDNQIEVLNALNGERIWRHRGIIEIASLLGGASVAVGGVVAIVPYSSGEIFALRIDNGRRSWSDNLSGVRRVDAISSISDIRGNPVIDRDLVIASSHSGRLVAIDLASGARVWDRQVGATSTPWIAGEFIFVVSTGGEVVALTRREGRVVWVSKLPIFEDPEEKVDPIVYAGPVLVGDRLLIGSSTGKLIAVSPYTGSIMGEIEVGSPVFISPIVANGTVYVLTDDGEIFAFR